MAGEGVVACVPISEACEEAEGVLAVVAVSTTAAGAAAASWRALRGRRLDEEDCERVVVVAALAVLGLFLLPGFLPRRAAVVGAAGVCAGAPRVVSPAFASAAGDTEATGASWAVVAT